MLKYKKSIVILIVILTIIIIATGLTHNSYAARIIETGKANNTEEIKKELHLMNNRRGLAVKYDIDIIESFLYP
jgi:hypothetical protein